MKKCFLLLTLLTMSASLMAQEASVQTQEPVKEKKFTITPRAGFAASRFKGHLFHQPTGTSYGTGVNYNYQYNWDSLFSIMGINH